MTWYFRALGPLSIERDGQSVDLGGPQRILVLAVLLAHANRVVSTDTLVEALWGESPPPSHRVQLQVIISDLRLRLAGGGDRRTAPIVTSPPGYLLEVPSERYDVEQFRAGLAAARSAWARGDNVTTLNVAHEALERWQGSAFAGLTSDPVAHVAAVLDRSRLEAAELDIDARLADGRLAGLLARLVTLTAENPLHEGFHRQLMSVQARTGRRLEALGVYRALRRRTVEEMGIEPSAELRNLRRRILDSDPELVIGRPSPAARGRAWASAYRHLPPDLPRFVGRQRELSALLEGDRTGVVVLQGMPGVGKTSLAVHAAHRLAGRFPDVQIYVDLGGFAADRSPADPTELLGYLLRLVGVPPTGVPPGQVARAAVLRDRLAGRRVLVVLDDASDERQVRPLLPAGPQDLAIVTSRRTLALPASAVITVTPFSRADSMAQLSGVLGGRCTAGQEPAAVRLAAACGHLPLALMLAAERLRTRPSWPIDHLVSRLFERPLDELAARDRDVRSAFAASDRTLSPRLRALLRRLGERPAGAVIIPDGDERELEALVDEHLLDEIAPDRYRLHPLVHAYLNDRLVDS